VIENRAVSNAPQREAKIMEKTTRLRQRFRSPGPGRRRDLRTSNAPDLQKEARKQKA